MATKVGRVRRSGSKHGDPGEVYIGRPSVWGNPFVIGPDGTRAQVIEKYEAWIRARPALMERARRELKGKTLRCFCAPLACHGDVLARIAEEPEPRGGAIPPASAPKEKPPKP